MSSQVASAIAFVRDLKLAAPRMPPMKRRPRRDVPPGQPAASVDAGSVVSFVAGVSQQHQDDVLNSTLFAQLHADTVADRFSDIEGWYKAYVNVLGNVGYDIQNFNFTQFLAHNITFQMSEVVIEILGAIASGDEIEVVTTALAALRQDNDALTLFSSSSSSTDIGNFQIGVASDAGGPVTFSLGAFHFTGASSDTQFLWLNFSSSSTTLFKAAQICTLDEATYSGVRDLIIQKLGVNAQNFVANLAI